MANAFFEETLRDVSAGKLPARERVPMSFQALAKALDAAHRAYYKADIARARADSRRRMLAETLAERTAEIVRDRF